jgi:hypothetical protein
LNPELHACEAGTEPLEQHSQPLTVLVLGSKMTHALHAHMNN